jgi:diketogulonate reductase-like aldo/keto reductase
VLKQKDIFPIGIGTWGIGGYAQINPQNNDDKQKEALTYSINHGMNLIEATWWYAEGHSVQLISDAIKQSEKKRDDLFITSTVYPYSNPTINKAEKEIEIVLKTLNTKYLDVAVFSLSSLPQWGETKSIKLLNKLIKNKIIRFVGLTNFNLEMLTKFKKEFSDKLFSHEVTFSFEIRENQDLNILSFADNNKIKNIIFQPLRRNRTAVRNWPLLINLSNKYHRTQNQVILNWIVTKGYYPLTKSETIDHIDEHLDSLNFRMELSDIKKLDDFRPIGWNPGKIDWYKTGEVTPIFQLPNDFDEKYNEKSK